jgi:MFS family permease
MKSLLARHRDLRLLWIGETTSAAGTSVTTVVAPLIALTVLHASNFEVGAIAAATWLPWLLFGLGVGPIVDRVRRRHAMIGCDVLSMVLFVSVPVAQSAGVLTVAQLLGVAFAAGCVSVLFNTSYGRLLLDVVEDPAERATANGLLQGSASAARIAGIGLGGLLVVIFGATNAMLVDALSFVVSAICLASMSMREVVEVPDTRGIPLRRRVAEGLSFSFGDPLMRPLVLYGGTSNLALVGYQALLVAFLVRSAHVGAGSIGMLLALGACGGVTGAFTGNAIARRVGAARALFYLKVGACPCALLIPLAASGPREALVVVGSFGVGFGIVAGNVVSASFWQSYTPRELVARASASQNVFTYGTMPLGALLAGVLATVLGLRNAMWAMTALLPVTALWLVLSPYARLRHLPSSPATWPRVEAGTDLAAAPSAG